MCFRKIGLGPLRGMIGMGVIKPDDLRALLGRLPLRRDQLFGINVVTILRPVVAGVATADYVLHDAVGILELTQKHTATFVWISFLAMAAERFVLALFDDKHYCDKQNPLDLPSGLG